MDVNQLLFSFQALDKRFHKACCQIRLLTRRIIELQSRYDRAFHADQRTYRYTLRLRISTYEGVRSMYEQYAKIQAEKLEVIQIALKEHAQQLVQEDPESEADSWYIDSDEEADEEHEHNLE